MDQEPSETGIPASKHGYLYWFLRNTVESAAGSFRRHWLGASITTFVVLALLFFFRAVYQPWVLEVRKKSFLVVFAFLLLAVWLWARRRHPLVKVLAYLACISGVVGLLLYGGPAHDYIALYLRYRSLKVVELTQLPLTAHERLQPRNSIYSLALEKIQETEAPTIPDYVQVGGEYRWTLGIEPVRVRQFYGRVEEVVSVHPFDPSPNFAKREPVSFQVGEGMWLSRNSHTATIKNFNTWRYLNFEPADIKYVKDDAGQWVQVVSLIRWHGVFFPWPEFGGVQIIPQEKDSFKSELKLIALGTGYWVPPWEIHKHKFLVGQNNVPYEVSRYIAHSFRFQEGGFMGPMPWIHQGDVRIPDLPGDVNEQPFTTHFEQVATLPGMLFHYFGLEPYDPDKQGLNVSLFIPADGRDGVYVYKHYKTGRVLTGVSAVAAKVIDSRPAYSWERHGPVENRPYIKDIEGERRFFWLTTVVTYKDAAAGEMPVTDSQQTAKPEVQPIKRKDRRFIAGGLPNIVLSDADHNIPVWVSSNPDKWQEELRNDSILSRLWKANRDLK